MLKLIPDWLWVFVVAALVSLAGILAIQVNDARTELANLKAEVATATQKADREQRDKEQTLQTQANRVAHDDQTRQTTRLAHAVGVDRAGDSLRSTIANANAGATRQAPDVAALIADATTARNLLSQCASEYASVAKVADQLSDQVTGLQDFVASTNR